MHKDNWFLNNLSKFVSLLYKLLFLRFQGLFCLKRCSQTGTRYFGASIKPRFKSCVYNLDSVQIEVEIFYLCYPEKFTPFDDYNLIAPDWRFGIEYLYIWIWNNRRFSIENLLEKLNRIWKIFYKEYETWPQCSLDAPKCGTLC